MTEVAETDYRAADSQGCPLLPDSLVPVDQSESGSQSCPPLQYTCLWLDFLYIRSLYIHHVLMPFPTKTKTKIRNHEDIIKILVCIGAIIYSFILDRILFYFDK